MDQYDPTPEPSWWEKIIVVLFAIYSAIFIQSGKQNRMQRGQRIPKRIQKK